MSNSFNELGIVPPILKALKEMDFKEPTEVQRLAIPYILDQKDIIVMSKTGSGKTAVYGVSILQLTDSSSKEPQGLILTPTRELAVQVDSDIKEMSKYTGHKTTAVYGQHNIDTEKKALNKGVTIVSGTPGRVMDHISQGSLITKNIRFLVLDEADRMLDMGFIDQVVRIIKTLPKDRITLLFSATIPPEIKNICSYYMKDPVTVEIESPTMTVDSINQVYYRVERNEKREWLNKMLLIEQPESCIIFCNTRMDVDRVQNFLIKKGYASQALHGDIPQNKRLKTMEQFKNGEFHLLVATDVAARGIHVDDLSLVINYDIPVEKNSYVHRIGRTGRAGNIGKAISLVTGDDIMSLYEIEEHIGVLIEEGELPSGEVVKNRTENAGEWLKANVYKPASNKESHRAASGSKSTSKKPKKPLTHTAAKPKKQPVKSPERTPNQRSSNKNIIGSTGKTDSSLIKKPSTSIVIGPGQKAAANPVINKTPSVQPASKTTKKDSFFKKIVQRLFGK